MAGVDDNVIDFHKKTPDLLVCKCGSQWFNTAVCVSVDDVVRGYALPLVCRDCDTTQ